MSDFERDESGFYKPRDPFIGTTKITKEDIVQDFRSPADALPTTPTQPADEEMIEAGYRALVACKPMTSTDCEREACEAIYTAMRALAKPDDGVVRDALERGLEYAIEAANEINDADSRIFQQIMRDVAKIEAALASLVTGDDGIEGEGV